MKEEEKKNHERKGGERDGKHMYVERKIACGEMENHKTHKAYTHNVTQTQTTPDQNWKSSWKKAEKKGQTPLFKVKQTPKEIETKKSAGVSKEKKVRSRFDEKVEI